MVEDPFQDRLDAGERLALALEEYRGSDALVLGLARGGVEVGFSVARALELPLQALVVRKLGAPMNRELALGAVSETGVRWIDYQLARSLGVSTSYLDQEIANQVREAQRRQQEYAAGHDLAATSGRPVVVVDDGIATGATALVAVRSVRDLDAEEVILATPTASTQAAALLAQYVDRFIALIEPDPFLSVGTYYRQFTQVSDADVCRYLRDATP